MLLANMNGMNGLALARARQLGGAGLAGVGEVKALQQALVNLAYVTGRPQINPGSMSGIVDPQTVMAVVAASDLLFEHMSTTKFVTLKIALAAASFSETARNAATKAIEEAAVPLTVAANTAATKLGGGMFSMFGTASFWTSTVGIGLLVIGAIVGYKLLTKPSTSASS